MISRSTSRSPSHPRSRFTMSGTIRHSSGGVRVQAPLFLPAFRTGRDCSQTPEDDLVGRHRYQDQNAKHRIAHELADPGQSDDALLEQVDERRTEERPDHRTASAEDIDAADNDGRHDLELEARPG